MAGKSKSSTGTTQSRWRPSSPDEDQNHHLMKTRIITLAREMRGKDGEYVFKFLPMSMYKPIKVVGSIKNDHQLPDENVKYLLASCLKFRIIITVC